MNTTFTIPEGFELKQTGDNSFEIVKKENVQTYDECEQSTINCDDFHKKIMEDALNKRIKDIEFSKHNNMAFDKLENIFEYNGYASHEMYQSGLIPQLTRHEMDLLKFCHNTDMKKFLKEEVWDKPIDYSKIDGTFDGISYYGQY